MIQIDYGRDSLLTEQGLELVRKHYLQAGEQSPQDAYARTASRYASNPEHGQRIYDAVSKQHFMFASPILSNSGSGSRGLPISCFLSYVPDTIQGLIDHEDEAKWLSVLGGGVGGHWSDVRGPSDKAPGAIPFLHSVDGAMTAYRQGKTRKGAYAAYMDASHPEIMEFITFRTPGGDSNRKSHNLHNAVNFSDHFMYCKDHDLPWQLIDPKSGEVKATVRARDIWEATLTTRHRTGEPMMTFIDTANEALHPAQKSLRLSIRGSNLCNEIYLVTSIQRTAVCCLSSLNLETIDEWPETLVGDIIEMLDNVLDDFIENAPDVISKARYAAMRSRDVGLGAMGWHGLLMKRSIAFESREAEELTDEIFTNIKRQAVTRSLELARTRGSCPDAVDTSYIARNLHLLAIAPNANSSIICNCTPSIEPINSNAYPHRTRIGTHLIKNKFLEALLLTKAPLKTLELMGMTVEAWMKKQWEMVLTNGGSVQKLSCLNAHEKEVYKTFKELDMHAVVRQAGIRQKHLCQGQSVNLYFAAKCTKALVNSVHDLAHKLKLKGLYYLRTGAVAQADKLSTAVIREILGDADECVACQG